MGVTRKGQLVVHDPAQHSITGTPPPNAAPEWLIGGRARRTSTSRTSVLLTLVLLVVATAVAPVLAQESIEVGEIATVMTAEGLLSIQPGDNQNVGGPMNADTASPEPRPSRVREIEATQAWSYTASGISSAFPAWPQSSCAPLQ